MTDDELKALVAENSRAIRDNSRAIRELSEESRALRQESERRWQESERRWQESDRRWQESRQETERLWQEIQASRRESDRLITSFNRQLGQLGNKLGGYTESLFRPSLERALREQFGMTVVYAPLRVHRLGEDLEIDMVGHTVDERNEAYLVEIKSQLRQETIDQLLDHLRQFPRFCPEHRGKKLFGIVAALEIPSSLKTKVSKEGLYLASIRDDVFEIAPPDDFVPRAFGIREA